MFEKSMAFPALDQRKGEHSTLFASLHLNQFSFFGQ